MKIAQTTNQAVPHFIVCVCMIDKHGVEIEDREFYSGGSALAKGREMTQTMLERSPDLLKGMVAMNTEPRLVTTDTEAWIKCRTLSNMLVVLVARAAHAANKNGRPLYLIFCRPLFTDTIQALTKNLKSSPIWHYLIGIKAYLVNNV